MVRTPFHYLPLRSLPGRLLVTPWLSAIYGALSSVRLVTELVRHPSVFFAVGDHRPSAAILDRYGRHRLIPLPKAGIKLHCVEAGDRSRPLMLLVHGFPECWFSWRHQIETFKADYRVVAVNMRGYGDSDKPRGVAAYSADLLTDDLVELIQSLTSETSSSSSDAKCVLVAHDWGGVVAWNVAQHRPDLVHRFVALNAPHPIAWQHALATSWQQFAASWYMFLFNVPYLAEINIRSRDFRLFDVLFGRYSTGADELNVYKHYFAQPYGITGPLNYYRAMLRGYGGRKQPVQKPQSSRVQPKTLILWGRDDTALIPELAHDSARHCLDAQVEYLSHCSHWIQIHRPEQVNEAMRRFLSSNS